jgi:hypothetical protein
VDHAAACIVDGADDGHKGLQLGAPPDAPVLVFGHLLQELAHAGSVAEPLQLRPDRELDTLLSPCSPDELLQVREGGEHHLPHGSIGDGGFLVQRRLWICGNGSGLERENGRACQRRSVCSREGDPCAQERAIRVRGLRAVRSRRGGSIFAVDRNHSHPRRRGNLGPRNRNWRSGRFGRAGANFLKFWREERIFGWRAGGIPNFWGRG